MIEHEHQGECIHCGEEMKTKPRQKFKGEARRNRKTISVKVPQDSQEDGAALWDDLIEQLRAKYETPDMPVYHCVMRGMYEGLTS